jgi:glyoxylase-like metal-dependent hydrolase (beta-lactamase superfamily II)
MALGQANTVSAFVIKAPKITLVDCGYASSYENVLAGLGEVGVSPSDVRYIIPTHVHLDHAGAAGRLLKEMPNAQIVSHEKGTPHLIDPARLIDSATRIFGKAIMEMYGLPEPVPAERITSVSKEMHLELGGGVTATLVHAPGHAPHQLAVMLDGERNLLSADAVSITYPEMKTLIPTTPPPSLDPSALFSTVKELGQTDPKALLVPHFGVRRDAESVFEETVKGVREWIAAVADLKKAGKTFDEITEEMVARVTAAEGAGDLPIYAKISVRTSVIGIIHYLEKRA